MRMGDLLSWALIKEPRRQEAPMRVTTLFRRLLGVTGLRVLEVFSMTNGSLSVEVAPGWRKPRCSGCGRVAPGYDRRPVRWWRHLAWGRTVVQLSSHLSKIGFDDVLPARHHGPAKVPDDLQHGRTTR